MRSCSPSLLVRVVRLSVLMVLFTFAEVLSCREGTDEAVLEMLFIELLVGETVVSTGVFSASTLAG